MKTCCETGKLVEEMTAVERLGCHHDHCVGVKELKSNDDVVKDFIEFCSNYLDINMLKYDDYEYCWQDTDFLLDAYNKYLRDGEASFCKDYSEQGQ